MTPERPTTERGTTERDTAQGDLDRRPDERDRTLDALIASLPRASTDTDFSRRVMETVDRTTTTRPVATAAWRLPAAAAVV